MNVVCLLAVLWGLVLGQHGHGLHVKGPAGVSLGQPSPPDPRFGIVEAFVNPAAATEAGAGYSRILLRWDVIQPDSPSDWKPANVPDPLIDAEVAAGREVAAILIGTPGWARTGGGVDSRAVPDMDAWRAFVRRMAQQYQGRIRHWIIWNEPDVWMHDHPGSTWLGSDADYLTLLKTAYVAIKEVDPALQVHAAGLTYHWDQEYGRTPFLERLLDLISADPEAAANGSYFDGVVYHLYLNPMQTADVLSETLQALASHGMSGKSMWINETNAPPSDDPQEPPWSAARFPVSLDEQAAFILQEFAVAFSSGAERVEVYKLRNSAEHPESIEPFGLLRADDSRRPAFDAFRVATTYLAGFWTAYRQQQGDVQAVTFDRGSETTTVLWTGGRRPVRVLVRATAPEAVVVDQQGNTSPIVAEGGVYTLELPGAACTGDPCLIGGAPRLVVEAAPAQGRVALVPSPTATPTPTSTATATFPTATPTPSPAMPLPTMTSQPPTATAPAPSPTAVFTPTRVIPKAQTLPEAASSQSRTVPAPLFAGLAGLAVFGAAVWLLLRRR